MVQTPGRGGGRGRQRRVGARAAPSQGGSVAHRRTVGDKLRRAATVHGAESAVAKNFKT
jgi:hypothetical protein